MIALLVTQVIDFSTYCAGLVNGELSVASCQLPIEGTLYTTSVN
ncbi:hypothetical protein ACN222_05255 [Anabaena sp. FACHB-595]